VAWLLAVGLSATWAWAGNEGQADLDRATEAKLNVRTFSDLGEVIRLCESAMSKGLDKDNTQLAKELLVSCLVERAKFTTKRVLGGLGADPNWPQYRRFALEDLEKAGKLNPAQPEVPFLIAQLNLLPGGDQKQAAKLLDEAIRLSAGVPMLRAQALTLRAELQKDPQKKLSDLNEAIRLAPSHVDALRERGELYADQDKLEEALADLTAAIELAPNHLPTYEEQAIVLARMKRFDEALKAIERARKLAPKSVSPLIQRARIHAMQHNYKAALDDLDEALTMEPDSPGALVLRAAVYEEMDQTDKALADLDRLLEVRPSSPTAMRLRAMLLAGMGKFDEAVRQMEQLAKNTPEDIDTQMQLAVLYTAASKLQKALEIYTTLLAQRPDEPRVLRARGDLLLTTGKHAEAIADYERALKVQPKDPGVLNNFAWVLATSPDDKLRNGRRAIELAKTACEVTGYKEAHILSTLAAAYAETGDFKTAIQWSEKAVQAGTEEQKEALSKELASYRAGKPWRELLREPEKPKPSQFRLKRPSATKPKLAPGKPAPKSDSSPAAPAEKSKPAAK